jgi:hypothetical protein
MKNHKLEIGFIALLAAFFVFCDSRIAISDVTIPSGTKNIYSNYSFNRLGLYLVKDLYLADDSGNTMLVQAPDLADDNTVFVLPPNNGTADYGLLTDGSGGTAWTDVLLPAKAQTVTNKTIDADLNTISNIDNDEVKAAAAIDLTKLAATTANRALASDASGFVVPSAVTDTELGYLSGTTSDVQTQIDGKVAKAGDTMTGELIMNPATGTYGINVDVSDTGIRGQRIALPVGSSLTGLTLFHAGTGVGALATVGDNNALQLLNNSTSGTAYLRNQNASGPVITMNGSSSGTLDISVPNAVTSYGVTFPAAQGSAGQILKNTAGDGVLDWASADLVDDTTPQLGGDLDVNGFDISSTSNGDVVLNPDGTGNIVLDDGAANTIGQVWTATDTAGAGEWADSVSTLQDSYDGGNTITDGTNTTEFFFSGFGNTALQTFVNDSSIHNGYVIGLLDSSNDGTALRALASGAGDTARFQVQGTGRNIALENPNGDTIGVSSPLAGLTSWDMTLPPNDGSANQVLTTDGSGVTTWETVSSGDLVDDLTPQLGGPLDVNGQIITSASDGDIAIEPDGTGVITTDAGIFSTVPNAGGPAVFPADETHATPSSTGASYFAQSFTAVATGSVTSIDLSLVAGGGTTGTYTVSLWSDNGSNEPQTELCTTAALDLSLVTTSEPPITTHAISGCPVVNSGTKYLAVVDRTGLTSGSLSAKVNTGNPYAGGNYISSNDAITWTQQASFDTKIVVTAQDFFGNDASFTSIHGASEHLRLYNPGETKSVLIKTGPSLDNYIITLPDAQGGAGSVLENDGSGNLSWGTAGQVVDDTTPQLGGDLDVNGNEITSASNGDVVINPDGTGKIVLNDGSASTIGEAWIATDTAGSGNWQSIPSGDVVDDTSPQLGGDLDVNSFDITSASDGDVAINPDGEGNVTTDAGIIIDVPSESGAPSDAINETTYATVSTATQTYFGQFFQSASTGSPTSGSFTFFQNGAATGTLTASIYTDSGSEPDSLLCTSAGVDASTVTTDTGFPLSHTTFTFVGCPSISSGTNYHMIVDTTGLTGGSLSAKVSNSSQYSPGNYLRSTDFVTWSQFATLEMEIVVVTQVINDNDYSIKSINGQSKHFELSNSLDTEALTIKTGNSLTSHTLTLPESQGAAGTVLENDGSGVLSWAAPSSGVTIETPASVADCTVSEQTICVPQNIEDAITESNLGNLDSASVTNYTHTFTGLSINGSFLVTLEATAAASGAIFRFTLPGAGTNYYTKINGIHGSCGATTSGASSDGLGIYRAGITQLFVFWTNADSTDSRTFRCTFSGYVDDI